MFNLRKSNKTTEDLEIPDYKEIIRLYADAAELAKIGGWEVDLLTNIISWSKIMKDIHEVDEAFTPDLQTAINFYKPGESRDTITRLVKNAVEKGEPYDAELQIITAKGNERWVRAKGKAEFRKKECVRLYGVFYDIHTEKLKDAQLEYSRQLFAQTFNNAPIGIAMLAMDGKLLNINDRVCDYIGCDKDELLQFSLTHMMHADDVTNDYHLMEQLIKGDINSYETEKRFINKEEHIIWILLSVSLVRDSNRKPMHFIMHLIDITKKKQMEKVLKDERILLQTLIDNLPLNVYVKDLKSRKVLVNKMEATYMNTAKKDILGKNDFELYPQESASLSVKEDSEVFTTGSPILNKETVSTKHDGTTTWFLSSKIPVLDELNEIRGLVGISYDITERKKHELQLKNLIVSSDLQNKKLVSTAQAIIHKLNTHSSNLSGFIDTLEKENAADHKQVIDLIQTILESLKDAVKNLNNLNR